MKVALLFHGQPRYLKNPFPLKSHTREILDKYETDVYVHTWFDEEQTEYEFSTWSRISSCPIEPNSPQLIEEFYNPKVMKVEKPQKFAFSEHSRKLIDGRGFRPEDGWHDQNYNNILSSLYSIESVCNLVEPYKDDYDFIILSRLDNLVYRLPDLNELNNDRFYLSDHHPRFPDLLFFFGPNYLDTMKVYSNVDSLVEKHCHELWGPSLNEPLKMFNYLHVHGGTNVVPTRLPVRVVRDNEGRGDVDKLFEYQLTLEEMFG